MDVDFYRHPEEMLLNSKMLKSFSGGIGREMTTIDPRAAMKVQTEMVSAEKVYWAGMPNPRVIFHSDDWDAIPFTLIWTAFFVFWEADALGIWGRASRGGNRLIHGAMGNSVSNCRQLYGLGTLSGGHLAEEENLLWGDEPSHSNPARRMEAEDELDVSRGNSDDRARRDSYGDAVVRKKVSHDCWATPKNT